MKKLLIKKVAEAGNPFEKHSPWFFYSLRNGQVIASLKKSSKESASSGQLVHELPLNRNDFLISTLDSVLVGSFCKLIPDHDRSKVLVEYSSPNVAKPFHIGHLRSTLVGHFISNVASQTKRKVVRVNYLGDWGTQFGLVLAGLGAKEDDVKEAKANLDSIIKNCDDQFESNSSNQEIVLPPDKVMRQISEAYVRANSDTSLVDVAKRLTVSMEAGRAPQVEELWKIIRAASIDHLVKTYRALGIEFDEYMFESDFCKDIYDSAVEVLENFGLVNKVEGQMIMQSTGIALGRSDGASLYLGRDLVSALLRMEKHLPTEMLYVIDKSQERHVSSLIECIHGVQQRVGEGGPVRVEHVKFGRITGMSTRAGSGTLLSDIMNEAFWRMAKQQDDSKTTRDKSEGTTRTLALSTLLVYLLKQRRLRDFNFSWDQALQGSGDGGVKLQYTHSRLSSLEERSGALPASEFIPEALSEKDLELITNLAIILANYEDVLRNCEDTHESSHLVSYLFKLCGTVSKCLKEMNVKDEEDRTRASQRLLAFSAAKLVLGKSMTVLGLKPLVRM